MKLRAGGYCLLATVLFATGCAEERIPPVESDAWEVADDKASSQSDVADSTAKTLEKTSVAKENTTSAPTPLPDGVAAILKGEDFSLEGKPPLKEDENGYVRIQHYFAITAPVEFQTTVTMIESEIEGQNHNGAVPIVGMRIQRTKGKYQAFTINDRPIDGPQVLKDKVEIGPGQYEVMISYYKDTIGQQRPAVTIKKITFHTK